MNLPAIFKKGNGKLTVNTKERLLKNKDALLEAYNEKMEGNKACPIMLGQPCVNQMCMFFMKFYSEDKDKNKTEFWACTYTQQTIMLSEINANVRRLSIKEAPHENTENNKSNL